MMPIGPLMIEHRLIERLIAVLVSELERMEGTGLVQPVFIDNVADFFRTYADRTHHGKEEDILFRDLADKQLSAEHKETMDELIDEHVLARKKVGVLLNAKEAYVRREPMGLVNVLEGLSDLVAFYPAHIEKEDKHFFVPCMEYFSKQERDHMLAEFREFDRNMIHWKYRKVVEEYEQNPENRDVFPF